MTHGKCPKGPHADARRVRQMVESGPLELILPDLDYETIPLHILYPHRRNLPHRMLVFMDWLEDIAASFLREHDRSP